MSEHPIHQLDDDVHQRVRLGILSALQGVAETDFAHLKTTLGLTDGNLGRHLQLLAAGNYISLRRVTGDGHPRTWVSITRVGRQALRREVRALQELLAGMTDLADVEAPDPEASRIDRPSERA